MIVISLFRVEKTKIIVISPRHNEKTKWRKLATIIYILPDFGSPELFDETLWDFFV